MFSLSQPPRFHYDNTHNLYKSQSSFAYYIQNFQFISFFLDQNMFLSMLLSNSYATTRDYVSHAHKKERKFIVSYIFMFVRKERKFIVPYIFMFVVLESKWGDKGF